QKLTEIRSQTPCPRQPRLPGQRCPIMEALLRALPPRPKSAIGRHAITTVLVGVSFLFVVGLQGQGGVLGLYLLFPAIFLSAVLLDRGAGIYSAVLSTVFVGCYLLVRPGGDTLPPNELLLALVIFVLIALGLAIVSEGLRTAWERAASAERTKDLLLN